MPGNPTKLQELDPAGIRLVQQTKLAAMLREVLASNSFYQRKLGAVSFDAMKDPIERLPFTTRGEIEQDQLDHPPYGSNLTYPKERYVRLHQTSGSTTTPLRWLDTAESWTWFKNSWKTIYQAAGFQPTDRYFFPFSFGPFIGFWGGFEAAAELGSLVLAGGGMSTAARLRHLLDNQATVVCCTPTYALRMVEVAAAEGIDLAASSVRALVVAGEPGGSILATRRRIEDGWGARVFDHSGMTEIGAYGFECEAAPGGMHVLETEFIAEIVDFATGQPIAGEGCGELVLTNLGRWGSPLIRYRTGDQARVVHGRCACGRWSRRLEGGILGRVDDMVVVRGNNVFPSALEGIIREFREVVEFSISVDGTRATTELALDIEPAPTAESAGLAERIRNAIRDRLHFRPTVRLVSPGSLPRFELKARRVIRPSAHA